jgi:hypothetical protein
MEERGLGIARCLATSFFSRLIIFLIGCAAVLSPSGRQATADHAEDRIALLPAKWDASWYLGVAAGGYRWQPHERNSRLAFFPAYPLSLRAVGRSLRLPQTEAPWLWTGVFLSTLCFGLALFFIAGIARTLFSESVARTSMFAAAAYPFALFHGQVYPEALFLLAASAATWSGLTGRWRWCLAAGIVAGLSRPTGVLVVLLVAWAVARRSGNAPFDWRRYLPVLGPAIGLGIYCAYVYALTGHPLTWLTDQAGWGRAVQLPHVLLADVASSLGTLGFAGYVTERPYEAINLGALIVGLGSVIPVWRRIGWGPALFVLFSVGVPLVIGGLPSMGRYTAVLFPIFILIGLLPRRFGSILIAVMFAAQAALAIQFFTSQPVF